MATRSISTRITLDGEQEFKKEMDSVNRELKNLGSEMKLVEAEFKGQANTTEALTKKSDLLSREIEQQKEKIKALEKAVEDSAEAFGATDKRTDDFRRSLNYAKTELLKMNNELENTDKYLKEAEAAADGCATSIDEFGKSTKESGGFLAEYGDKLKLLGAAGIAGAAVNGLKEVADAVLEVEESTREYRQIMGTLEVSSQAAGYSAEETAQIYERLYGVLGDTQTAATTVANLQAIGLEQENLKTLVDATIGAWATYGDSIPIDGLSEAINETSQVAQVTGVLADVLNWAGISEEAFNEQLGAIVTQADRARFIIETLSQENLPNLGQAWIDVNEDIVKANESQAKLEEAWGRLGESLAPVADAIRTFGAEAITWLADTVTNALDVFVKFGDFVSDFLSPDSSKWKQSNSSKPYNGSHAVGLDYVPFDGYLAQLHKGERVLTATENQALTRQLSFPKNQMETIVINLTAEMDGATVARKTYTHNLAEAERHGTNYVNG